MSFLINSRTQEFKWKPELEVVFGAVYAKKPNL